MEILLRTYLRINTGCYGQLIYILFFKQPKLTGLYDFRNVDKLYFTTEENHIPHIPRRGEVWVQKQQGAGDIYQF